LAICAHTFGKLGQLDGLSSGVGAATCHDGHAAFGLLNGDPDDFAVFFYIHSRGFTGCAHHANAIGAFCNVPIDQFSQAGVIDRTVLQHGSDHSGNAACNGLKSFRHGE
jgi:hypothetical protein